MNSVGSVVSACFNWVWTPLELQLVYHGTVRERMRNLETDMGSLKARSQDVTKRIDAAHMSDPTQRPIREAEEWLQKVQEAENQVNSIKDEYIQTNLVSFYRNWEIGRKATMELETVKHLYKRGGDFINEDKRVTRPGTPPPGQQMPGTSNLVAVESNLQKVLGYLSDGARTVGIWGMGGVGKTSLLKAINNQLSSGGGDGMRFDHVIWVVVSSHAKIEKVQADIAENINLKLPKDIFNFLKNKKFIILLDDVWEPLDLVDMGIPDHRVVLFTTRSEDVCGQMEADKKVKVECLQKEEAWRLFADKVGEETINSSPEIKKLAVKVAEECEGLPLALIVLGRAMSSKHTLEEWRHTLESLKSSQPGTSSSIHNIFRRLKVSYDSLPNDSTRQCFLLCALYPEDYPFVNDQLLDYFWGHGLINLKECKSVGEIYDSGYDQSIGVLKSACLLEELEWGGVKMHDVLRDMALWIARDCGQNNTKWIVCAGLESQEPLKGISEWEKAEKLSLYWNDMTSLPMPKIKCAKLSTFILEGNRRLKSIPKDYFQCFPALSYLNLSQVAITELPEEVSSLVELQYLDVSFTQIKSLSINLRNLKKLKHLILHRCDHLNYIPYGLISCLPRLEYLDIYDCAYVFAGENEGPYNFNSDDYRENDERKSEGDQDLKSDDSARPKANLDELKTLKEYQRIKFIALNLKVKTILDLPNVVDVAYVYKLQLIVIEDSDPQKFIVNLMKVGHRITELTLSDFHCLGELILTREQIRQEGELNDQNWCFSRLSNLELVKLNGLHKITWTKLTLLEIFPRLTEVNIYRCHGLQNLTWTGHLPCLKFIFVSDCNGLEEVISADENDEGNVFPKLELLYLSGLQNLRSIFNGILDISKWVQITMNGCPKLKRLPFSFQRNIANKRKFGIYYDKEGWEGLEWEDDTFKSYLQPFVHFVEA